MENKNNLIIELTSFFLVLGILNNIQGFELIRVISVGMLMFFGNFFLIISLLKRPKVRKSYFKVLLSYMVILSIYVIGFLIYPQINSIKIMLLMFSLVNFFIFYSQLDYSKCKYKVIVASIYIYIVVFLLIRIGILSNERFWRIFTLFPFLMVYFLIILYKRERKRSYIILLVMLGSMIMYANSRSVMLIIFISIFVYLFWNTITKNKLRHIAFFILTTASIFTFVKTYISWYVNPSELIIKINQISIRMFSKNLFSGRPQMWSMIMDEIVKRPILGHGTGISAGGLLGLNLSIHNLYLQLLIQNGIVGLVSFVILLFSIWMLFFKFKDRIETRLAAAFFISAIIHNTFEIILLQNHMAMAFFQWFIFAIGASKVIDANSDDTNIRKTTNNKI